MVIMILSLQINGSAMSLDVVICDGLVVFVGLSLRADAIV